MSSTLERKLAAIMFTDIAGYTEQMSKSESKTLDILEKKRSILTPLLKEHKGTFVKEIGDGTLTYFDSAVEAATCAVKLQETTYDDRDMNIRAGIHIGDIVFKDGDVFGDGVNVASRLESLAPSGGVCVSKNVYDELINQDAFDGIELGLQSLKGVGRLVEVFGLKGDKLNEPNPSEYQENKIDKHSDDEVPSIAIIPFENKGADEDVFYAYGISADLISDVSSAGLIRVASKKDIEKLDYTNLDNTQLSQKLFVRYIANGELWRMGDMFQLSIELYDTKDRKVVWSDRWQEKWDNLTTIKSSLSDGLLKALDTTSKVEKKAETANTKAYELYLKAKHTHAKRTDMNDTEKARKLLRQAIELDDTLIAAKLELGVSYNETGDNDEAMKIFTSAFEQAEKLGDKQGMGITLNSIGIMNAIGGEYDTALGCYERSLKIKEELGDKAGMAAPLGNIGNIHFYRGEYDAASEYHDRSLKIEEEIGDKSSMVQTLMNIGYVHNYRGEYDTALEYYDRSLKIQEEIGRMYSAALTLCNIGIVHVNRDEYDKAVESLEKSLAIQKEIGLKEIELLTTTYLYLTYKHLGKDYDEQDIHSLIKDAEYYDEINFRLYQLLDDTSYLKKAYTQVQETASELEEEIGKTFLGYPLPAAIVEEWERTKENEL